MRLAVLAQTLRDTSERFGGIKHYLEAAGDLDRACNAFYSDQSVENLARLNGAAARADRCRKESTKEKGPVAV